MSRQQVYGMILILLLIYGGYKMYQKYYGESAIQLAVVQEIDYKPPIVTVYGENEPFGFLGYDPYGYTYTNLYDTKIENNF